jgi:hypothetical protein
MDSLFGLDFVLALCLAEDAGAAHPVGTPSKRMGYPTHGEDQ